MDSAGAGNSKRDFAESTKSGTANIIREGSTALTPDVPTNVDDSSPDVPAANADEPDQSKQEDELGIMRDPDQYIPISNVVKNMRNVLPPYAKIADDAKETVQECVSEFISFITREANAKCHREYRRTITPEDIIAGMGSLGFNNYVDPLSIFLNKHRSQHSGSSSTSYQLPYSRRHGSNVIQQQPLAPFPMAAAPPPLLPSMNYGTTHPQVALTGAGDGSTGPGEANEFDLIRQSK